jgi:hypothetical protein
MSWGHPIMLIIFVLLSKLGRLVNERLYIDGLFYKGSGIGRYYESLTKEFAKRGIEIFTCVPKKITKISKKILAIIETI